MLTCMASATPAIACCFRAVIKCAALLQQSEAGKLTVWLTVSRVKLDLLSCMLNVAFLQVGPA